MSFRPGSSDHPDSVTTSRASMVAPHAGQLRFAPSLTKPHQGQVCVGMGRCSWVNFRRSDQLIRQSRRDEIFVETIAPKNFPRPFMGGIATMSLLTELFNLNFTRRLQIFRPYGTLAQNENRFQFKQ